MLVGGFFFFFSTHVTLSSSASEPHLSYVEGENADSCSFFASLIEFNWCACVCVCGSVGVLSCALVNCTRISNILNLLISNLSSYNLSYSIK